MIKDLIGPAQSQLLKTFKQRANLPVLWAGTSEKKENDVSAQKARRPTGKMPGMPDGQSSPGPTRKLALQGLSRQKGCENVAKTLLS